MASVTDASGFSGQVKREHEKLAAADMDDDDRDAIEKFVRHRKTHGSKQGGYSASSEVTDMNKLRLSGVRAETPLLDMGLDDFNRFSQRLRDEYGLTTGITSYHRVLRLLFEWLESHNEYGDYGWFKHIGSGNVEWTDPSDREFPRAEQIDAMKEAARKNNNPRNAAIVSFYADSAVRLTLGCQLRVGDITLPAPGSNERATFTPNPDGEGQKDVEVKPYPLYDCVSDLRVWINNFHPAPEDDDAPLWTVQGYENRVDETYCHHCRTEGIEGGYCDDCDEQTHDDGAISSSQLSYVIRTLADDAGIDRDEVEVKPHSFRHSAIGRWKERGYSLAQVQRRVAWTDRSAADMWAKYGDPDDAAIDSKIDGHEGREPTDASDDDDPTVPERFECGNCGESEITADYCGSCGWPVSPSARERADASASTLIEEDRLRQLIREEQAERLESSDFGMREGIGDSREMDHEDFGTTAERLNELSEAMAAALEGRDNLQGTKINISDTTDGLSITFD